MAGRLGCTVPKATLRKLGWHGKPCVDRKLNSTDVLDALTDLFILRCPPEYIRSDNGSEFIAQKVRDWIAAVGAKTAYIEPGLPWKMDTAKASMQGSGMNC